MGDQKINIFRASEGTLICWSQLHLQLATNQLWARVVGFGPFSLCVIHNKGSGDINGLMMMY
jgi:hypothetical protein